jgi:hypothetical protein
MVLLAGTLEIEDVNKDRLQQCLARYFSTRNWKVEYKERRLIAHVGTTTDLLFRGYVFFCKQVEFDLSQSDVATYRFKPNWLVIGLASIGFCLVGIVVIGSQYSGQETLKVIATVALLVPFYALFMITQLKSVILTDLKAAVAFV